MQILDVVTLGPPPAHIFREQNKVADALAKMGQSLTDFNLPIILSSAPSPLAQQVYEDSLGTSYLRMINSNSIILVCQDVATNAHGFCQST